MRTKDNLKTLFSQEEIDRLVVAQANDDSDWEEPIQVSSRKPTALALPAELAVRATFLAHLHRKATVEEWLMDIIQERLALEETVYLEVKREFATKRS